MQKRRKEPSTGEEMTRGGETTAAYSHICSHPTRQKALVNITSSMHIIITQPPCRHSDGLVQQQRFADILNLGNRTLQVEGLGQNNLEDLFKVSRVDASSAGYPDLLDIDAVAGAAEYQACFHRLSKPFGLPIVSTLGEGFSVSAYLNGYLLLILAREVNEMVILCSNEERNGRLVESPALAVPFLDRVQSALPGEIKHEQDSNGVVAHQWKHVHELSLTAKVPNREGDLRIADGDGLFHEVDPYIMSTHSPSSERADVPSV